MRFPFPTLLSSFLLVLPLFLACGNSVASKGDALETPGTVVTVQGQIPLDIEEEAQDAPLTRGIMYDEAMIREHCFAVVSKKHFIMNVYEVQNKDTVLLASYPVCIGRNPGNKQSLGDKRTPESGMTKGFPITEILPSHTWKHDFGDGRGSLLSYGAWFMRLGTPGFRSIGIHGSTNNESSVPGRDSEGCIRLRDKEIIHFHNQYAFQGMTVYVLKEDEENHPFQRDARGRAQNGVPVDELPSL